MIAFFFSPPLSSCPVATRTRAGVTTQPGVGGMTARLTGNAGLCGADWNVGQEHVSTEDEMTEQGAWTQVTGQGRHLSSLSRSDERKDAMTDVHPAFTLKRYERVSDAAYAAELRAELYGDAYLVVDTGMGFAAIRESDMDAYKLDPWRVVGVRGGSSDAAMVRQRLNAIVYAVTSERTVTG